MNIADILKIGAERSFRLTGRCRHIKHNVHQYKNTESPRNPVLYIILFIILTFVKRPQYKQKTHSNPCSKDDKFDHPAVAFKYKHMLIYREVFGNFNRHAVRICNQHFNIRRKAKMNIIGIIYTDVVATDFTTRPSPIPMFRKNSPVSTRLIIFSAVQ